MTTKNIWSIALAAMLVACAPEAPLDLSGLSQPITDGQLYSGHPSVGFFVLQTSDGQQAICTGSVIGKKTVLTAAHCVDNVTAAVFVLNGQISGGQLYGDQYQATAAAAHPSYTKDPAVTNDVAVVQLEKPVPVPPIPIATSAPTVGLPVTLVGYGLTGDNNQDDGVKRKAANQVAQVTPMEVVFQGTGGGVGNICNGDSGGPTFATLGGQEVQIGVHSYGLGTPTVTCMGNGHDMRVDVFASWIKQTAGGDVALQGGTPPTTPPTNPPTNPQSGTYGSACTAHGSCQSGICVQLTATSGLCSQQCQGPADCPGGATCVPTDQPNLSVCDPTSSPSSPSSPPPGTQPPGSGSPTAPGTGGTSFGGAAASDGGCSMTAGQMTHPPLGLLVLLLLLVLVHAARKPGT